MNDSNETPISTDAAGSAEMAAKAASGRKLLRSKMSAVLQAWPKVLSARGVNQGAQAESTSRWKIFQGVHLPPTEDENRVRDYLAKSQARFLEWYEAGVAHSQSQAVLKAAEIAWYSATVELSDAVTQAIEVSELAQDDIFLAAQRMQKLAPVADEAPAGWSAEAPPKEKEEAEDEDDDSKKRELTEPEKAQLAALAEAVLEAARAAAVGFKVGPQVVDGIAKVRNTAHSTVQEPTRPTEEEIQRYLRQLEMHCDNRQNAHWELNRLLDEKAAILTRLTEASSKLDEQVKAAPSKSAADTPIEFKTILHVAAIVAGLVTKSYGGFGEDYNRKWLFAQKKPKMSGRETRQRDELRKMMKQMALAMANLNEASASLNVASRVTLLEFQFEGAHRAASWQEALEWRERMDKDQALVAQRNEQRNSKIELLKEAVERYTRDKKDAGKDLRRYMLTILPTEPEIPADELRHVLNAVAIMTTPRRDDGDYRTGDYPVY